MAREYEKRCAIFASSEQRHKNNAQQRSRQTKNKPMPLTSPEENNEYALLNFKRDYSSPDDTEGTQKFQRVVFYKLNPDGSHENGTTLEEMLRVSIERLQDLNGRSE